MLERFPYLKISDVEIGEDVPELAVRVMKVGHPRIIRTRTGKKTQLTEVLLGDETGTTILTLWGFREAEDLAAGKIIKITDGWAKEWQGKMQLTLGRSGKMEEVPDDGTIPSTREIIEENKEDKHIK
ncbi:hypothetical protein EU537_04630 [Candidatus Thorarchaeota archaeon]|nr:MAG: hypothetical protein EU537_04630 [Candidatus Thorarchaeota archaeon]